MSKTQYTPAASELTKRYKRLSPMMKLIFSAKAQLRYAQEHTLFHLMSDLEKAESVCHFLLTYKLISLTAMSHRIHRELESSKRPQKILNYVNMAMGMGDAMVFRMTYLYGNRYGDMTPFQMEHPALIKGGDLLNHYTILLKRKDLRNFDANDPHYRRFYQQWVQTSRVGLRFEERRKCYTAAIKCEYKESNIDLEFFTLPHTGVGKRYIRELYCPQHTRDS